MYNPHTPIEILFEILLKDSLHWRSSLIFLLVFPINNVISLNTGGGVKVMKFWIVHLKMLIFGRPEHSKNSTKILTNTFSDSLAILKKNPAGASNLFTGRFPSHFHNSVQNLHAFPSCPLSLPPLGKSHHCLWPFESRVFIENFVCLFVGVKPEKLYSTSQAVVGGK